MKALARFLYNAYKPTGRLYLIPLLVAAGTSILSNVIPRLFGNSARKKALADAANTFIVPQAAKDAVSEAKGIAAQGDPNYNNNQRQIERQQANAVQTAKVSGNVSDILGSVAKSQQIATDASLKNSAQDTQYRFNAKRFLTSALQGLGQTQGQVQRENYGAVQTEFGRQQQNLQQWAAAGNNLAGDITSYGLMKQYGQAGLGSGFGGGYMPSYPNQNFKPYAQ